MRSGVIQVGKFLYVCNECDRMHADETSNCETCESDSIRIVLELELLEGLQWEEEGNGFH